MNWDELKRWLAELKNRISGKPDLRWAVVTSLSPLSVQLDGDSEPLFGVPSSIARGYSQGERVLCAVQNRRVTVLGRGGRPSIPDTPWVNITPATGWAALGGHTPRCRVVDGVLWLEGAFVRNTGGSLTHLGTIPASVPITGTKTVFVGGHFTIRGASTAVAEVYLVFADRRLKVDGYSTIDGNPGWYVPISGSLLADQN